MATTAPFVNALLFTRLVRDTHFKDAGNSVFITPWQNEVVLLFSLDGQDAARFRECLGLHGPVCDLLVLRAALTHDCRLGSVTLCLVELKGGDVGRALEQLESTYDALRHWQVFSSHPKISWKGIVKARTGAPRQLSRQLEELKRKGLPVVIRRKDDISDEVRKI